jgi:NAD(P)H-dependent flavin oxidoreductase YrpB (nitropropane dioxygenase family)
MLKTAWTDAWESPESPGTLPMPMQFMLISDALARINRAGAGDLTTFPVGQIVGTMNQVKPTSRVIYEMVEEYIETMERLSGLIED